MSKKKNKKHKKYLENQTKHLEDNMEHTGTAEQTNEEKKDSHYDKENQKVSEQEKNIPAEEFYKKQEQDDSEIGPPQDLKLKLQIEQENSIALTKLLQQLQADFDNYRKRNANIKQEAYNDGVSDTVKRMLNCYDAIEGALRSIDDENVREGLEILKRDFLNAFADFGVTPIEALGKNFDANLHNAISTEEVKDKPGGTIIQEIQKGFMTKDKVVRYSLVIIAK